MWETVGHEIRHRVRDPGDFRSDTFRTKPMAGVQDGVTDLMAQNVYMVLGKLKPDIARREGRSSDSMVLQSVRFRTEVERDGKMVETGWTMERAKKWWEEHGEEREDKGAGEYIRLQASVTGEIRVEDVPLAPGVNLAALKVGDEDPLEVVVEIPAGRSRRGWNYLPSAIQAIVRQVASETASGFLGHQKPEEVDYQFPPPVTHWVGAVWRDGKAYIRGVIDAAAKDLKRWIRAGRVRQVSIYGMPTLRTVAGEKQVVDYRLLSIDWTPLDRAGMATSVVAVGEMDSIISGGGDPPTSDGGGKPMTLAELIAKLKEFKIGPKQLAGELGWKLDEVAGEIDDKRWSQIQAGLKALGEIAGLFGLGTDAKLEDLVGAVKAAREAQVQAAKADRDKLVDKVIGEMVVAEAARPLVKRMLQVPDGADEAAIRKAVGEMLESEDVKKALQSVFKDTPITPKTPEADRQPTGVRVKRVAI